MRLGVGQSERASEQAEKLRDEKSLAEFLVPAKPSPVEGQPERKLRSARS